MPSLLNINKSFLLLISLCWISLHKKRTRVCLWNPVLGVWWSQLLETYLVIKSSHRSQHSLDYCIISSLSREVKDCRNDVGEAISPYDKSRWVHGWGLLQSRMKVHFILSSPVLQGLIVVLGIIQTPNRKSLCLDLNRLPSGQRGSKCSKSGISCLPHICLLCFRLTLLLTTEATSVKTMESTDLALTN